MKWYVISEEDNRHLRMLGKMCLPWNVDGIAFWLPIRRGRTVIDGVLREITQMVYEGYLYVGSDLPWEEIERKTGLYLLKIGDAPVPLSKEDVDRIKELEMVEYNVEPKFYPNQPVKFKSGRDVRFAGMRGRFIRLTEIPLGRFAKVEVDMYGEKSAVEIVPIDHLEAL